MSGTHTTRLAASNAHRHFVKELRRAVQKKGWHGPGDPFPQLQWGAEPLSLAVPPTLERAFGYSGDLRFLQFGYTAGGRQFGYSDGGDDLPSDEGLWSRFLHHPVVAPHLPESRYPTLYGRFASETERPALDEIMRSAVASPVCHCLLLDRRDRRAYIAQRDQTMILFALMEPEGGDEHTIFVDGLLM